MSGWQTATRKGGRQRVLHVTPIDSRDVTPSDVHRVSMDPRIVAEKITEEAASNQSDSEPNSKAESVNVVVEVACGHITIWFESWDISMKITD